jgi:hypothetical protein
VLPSSRTRALWSQAEAEVEQPVPAAVDTRRPEANDRPQPEPGTYFNLANASFWQQPLIKTFRVDHSVLPHWVKDELGI